MKLIDFEAKRIIEALRSGVSSREVGQYFSSARPKIMAEISNALENVSEKKESGGMIISGKYGEGKTHILNTIFNMAHDQNMVVSLVSLSKETPFDKPYFVYQKLVQGTYLPKRLQPGFEYIFENMTLNSKLSSGLLEYILTNLETNKLYYLLKSFLGTQDDEEKFILLADLEGDFIANSTLKQIYKRIFSEKVNFNSNFSKTNNIFDYFAFLSNLFLKLGYNGWVILFDEAELIGRLSKKARLNAYSNMAKFLMPTKSSGLEATYSFFAFNSSFVPDVIEAKNEFENLETSLINLEIKKNINDVLNLISSSKQLVPLSNAEIMDILRKIQDFHGKAYNWNPNVDLKSIFDISEKRGYLLRTRLRTAVEFLDQLYQYGEAGNIKINKLGQATFDEDIPSLQELLDNDIKSII